MLTVPEVSKLLRVSIWTVYREMHSGRLKSKKLRGRRLISRRSLTEFIENLDDGGIW